MKRRDFVLAIGASLALFAPGTVSAQANQALFDYQLKNKAQTDQGAPVLILRAREFIKSGRVVMERSDGGSDIQKIGRMKPGQEKRFPFRQKPGKYGYKISVEGTTQFDQTITMALETEVAWVDPIKLGVDRESVRVGEGELILTSNVPLERVEIEIFDNDGGKVVERTQVIDGKSGEIKITWPSPGPEVGGIRLTAHDVAGFWAGVILEPFWVEIPHEDIIFDFGKATWHADEEPKLKSTLKEVQNAMKKHQRKGLEMSMYVGGYTDTVGSAAENQKLSEARARAIGNWFKKSGVGVQVFFQGFGEKGLKVQTPDNTPEERNRRAVHILGNAPPPTSQQIPRAQWRRL